MSVIGRVLGKMDLENKIINGDCREKLKDLPEESVQCCVTSPPYWGLRDYGVENQIGLEDSPEKYVENIVLVFNEVHRILKKDGTLWLNLGDSYCNKSQSGGGDPTIGKRNIGGDSQPKMAIPKNMKPKDLVGIPWMSAFALRSYGWYLRQDIIWSKPNPMPESVTDRCTKSHEYIFLLSKSQKYFYNHEAIKEKTVTLIDNASSMTFGSKSGKTNTNEKAHTNDVGKKWDYSEFRNKRSVWTVTTKPYKDAHFATYPKDLITPCILAGSKHGDTILDPFHGSGTTGEVSGELGRSYIGIELNPDYVEMSKKRTYQIGMGF